MSPSVRAEASCSDPAHLRFSGDESPSHVFLTLGPHPLDPELVARVAQALDRAADLLAVADHAEQLAADDLLADAELGGDLLLGPSVVEVELDDAPLARRQAGRNELVSAAMSSARRRARRGSPARRGPPPTSQLSRTSGENGISRQLRSSDATSSFLPLWRVLHPPARVRTGVTRDQPGGAADGTPPSRVWGPRRRAPTPPRRRACRPGRR